MHVLKLIAEGLGGIIVLVTIVVAIFVAVILSDAENGDNPFQ